MLEKTTEGERCLSPFPHPFLLKQVIKPLLRDDPPYTGRKETSYLWRHRDKEKIWKSWAFLKTQFINTRSPPLSNLTSPSLSTSLSSKQSIKTHKFTFSLSLNFWRLWYTWNFILNKFVCFPLVNLPFSYRFLVHEPTKYKVGWGKTSLSSPTAQTGFYKLDEVLIYPWALQQAPHEIKDRSWDKQLSGDRVNWTECLAASSNGLSFD
jgi:hypothetical protein